MVSLMMRGCVLYRCGAASCDIVVVIDGGKKCLA